MKTFFDSSAFAKRFLEEAGSESVETICEEATELGLSVLCVPEIVSALNRRLRERSITPTQYAKAKQRLAEDVNEAMIVDMAPSVVASAIAILEASPVRTLDAVQIASALSWEAELFVTSDTRQFDAAKRAGLKAKRA